jgi:hypothetical protein
MRKIFMVLMLGLISIVCFGQNIGTGTATVTETVEFADNSESEIVKLMNNGSTLMKIERIALPSIKGVSFEVVIITDMVNGIKLGGLSLSTKYVAQYINETYYGTLDYTELDNCIRALTAIKDELTKPMHDDTYTEIRYETKDFVKIKAYYAPTNGKWFLSISPKSHIGKSAEAMQTKQIDPIINLIQQAKKIIEEEISKK